jgi:CRP-like cAMP-binding protein
MTTKTDYLEAVEVFQDLTASDMEKINHQTTMVTYKAGHLFYMPEDPAEVLFIIKQGRVQLYRLSTDGRKLVIAILKPGMIFGQMALIGQNLHNTFAEALDHCTICVWRRGDVERLMMTQPLVAMRLLEAMGRRVRDLEQRLEEVTYKRIPARLAGLLIRLEKEHGANGVVAGYTHQSLADMLGTYRETTTQTLNEFQNRNLIRTGRKTIEILNEDGLRKVAGT